MWVSNSLNDEASSKSFNEYFVSVSTDDSVVYRKDTNINKHMEADILLILLQNYFCFVIDLTTGYRNHIFFGFNHIILTLWHLPS